MSQQVANVGVDNSTATDTTTAAVTDGNLIGRTVVLGLVHLVNFIGNLLVIVCVFHSRELRKVPLNLFLANLCAINLLGAILSISLALGYSAAESWDFGVIGCQLNAYLLHVVDAGGLYTILMIWADRLESVRCPTRYPRKIRLHVVAILLTVTWLISCLVPLPFLIHPEYSSPHPNRYLCGPVSGGPLGFWVPLYGSLYLLPNLVIVFIAFFILFITCQDKLTAPATINYEDYTDATVYPEPPLSAALTGCKLVLSLWLLWLLCFSPYLGVTFYEASQLSAEVGRDSIYIEPQADTAITWLKFFFPALSPIIIFVCLSQLWSKLKDIALIRKSSTAVQSQPRFKRTNRENSLVSSSRVNFNYPTVIANQTGLHVEYGNDEPDSKDDVSFSVNVSGFIDSTMKVSETEEANYLSQVNDNPDTSDYDTDQLGQSETGCSSKLNSSIEGKKGLRNHSDPFRRKANSVSADSGIASVHNSGGKNPRLATKRAKSASQIPTEVDKANEDEITPAAPTETAVEEFAPCTPPVHKANNLVGEVDAPINPATDLDPPPVTDDNTASIQAGNSTADKPQRCKKKKRKSRLANGSVSAEVIVHPAAAVIEDKDESNMETLQVDGGTLGKADGRPPLKPNRLKPLDVNKISPVPNLRSDDQTQTVNAEPEMPVPTDSSKENRSRRKKKKRQRSAESEKPLLSSNTSTDMNLIKSEHHQRQANLALENRPNGVDNKHTIHNLAYLTEENNYPNRESPQTRKHARHRHDSQTSGQDAMVTDLEGHDKREMTTEL